MLEEIWLDGSHAGSIAPGDLSGSLYLFYRERLGLWIARAEDRLGQGTVPDCAPAAFGPVPGETTLLATRISWAQDGAAAEASRNWIDTRIAAYVTRIS